MVASRSRRAPMGGDVAVETGGAQTFRPALNLSRSGILVASDELPEIGAHVRVVISLPPSGRFVRLQGRVVRHQSGALSLGASGPAFAVAFEAVDEAELAVLDAYTSSA